MDGPGLTWDPNEHPRWPSGTNKGGEFAPARRFKGASITSGFKSQHLGTDVQYNEDNPGIGFISKGGYGVGIYKNSINKMSAYAVVERKMEVLKAANVSVEAGVLAGVVTGYKKKVIPLVLPEVIINKDDNAVAVTYVPAIKGLTPATIAVQLRHKF